MNLTPVDQWLLTTLQEGGVPADLGQSPQTGKPYVIIYPYYLGPDTAGFLNDSLRNQQYQLTYAGEGWEQIRKVQSNVHDLVLSSNAWSTEDMVAGVTISLAMALQKMDEVTWALIENLEVMVTDR